MGLLVLLAVMIGGTIALLLCFGLMSARRSGPVIPMIRIGIAASNIEAEMWVQRLHVTGIGCQVQGLSSPGSLGGPYYAGAYNVEVWVAAKDEETARELLGM